MAKPHIDQVDYIRAFASLAVAVYHLGGKTLPVLNNGWLGVQMFFLLSGFIICWAIPQNYSFSMAWRFIVKRLIRIEPPYIISIILAVLAHFILAPHYNPDWTNILFHFAYINSFLDRPYLNPVYWTLAIEFQFYLFVAVLYPIIIKRWSPLLLIIFCILPIWLNLPVNTLVNVFPIFALGILYFLYTIKVIAIKEGAIFMVIVAGVSFFRLGLLPTSAALFALLILVLPLKSNRLVSFFSKISFSLYLTHDIVGSNLVVFLGTKLPKTIAFKGVEFFTGISVSILFAYLFYKIVEEPSLRLSKKIGYKAA